MPSLPPCCLAIQSIFLRATWSRFPHFGSPGDHIFDLFGHPGRSIFGCFSMPGHSFSSPGAHLDDFWSHCQIFLKKVSSPTPPKGIDFGPFVDIFFNRFFGVLSFLDFYAFACPKGPFWLSFRLLFESPGLFKKQLKVCNSRRFSRFGPFRTQLFSKS